MMYVWMMVDLRIYLLLEEGALLGLDGPELIEKRGANCLNSEVT